MPFKVVNTIYVPGVDFGGALLDGIDAELLNSPGKTEDELRKSATDADAVICSGPVQPWTGHVIEALGNCRIIASLGIGYDRIDLETATRRNIVVTNIPDYCIDEVSSHALALILALNRGLLRMDAAQRSDQTFFVPPNRKAVESIDHPVLRARDATVGVVGFGKIGSAAALKARAMGMRVIAYDPFVWDAIIASRGAEPADFETLLKESDFISVNASLTEQSRKMFNDEAFRLMKPTAYLINTARGEIVDQSALIRAIEEKRIAGAGLDVTETEPIPPDDPILQTPNVILTGHSAWFSATADSEPEFWHKAMAQVAAALNGQWPDYAVNPHVKRTWMEKWGRKV
ncbi:MAG: C-terminal binding protein [Desulfobacterales bacterium]|nr:C-terminal binding protein [Desulfobacterales bacterium]